MDTLFYMPNIVFIKITFARTYMRYQIITRIIKIIFNADLKKIQGHVKYLINVFSFRILVLAVWFKKKRTRCNSGCPKAIEIVYQVKNYFVPTLSASQMRWTLSWDWAPRLRYVLSSLAFLAGPALYLVGTGILRLYWGLTTCDHGQQILQIL